jgi:hypothetical protein
MLGLSLMGRTAFDGLDELGKREILDTRVHRYYCTCTHVVKVG